MTCPDQNDCISSEDEDLFDVSPEKLTKNDNPFSFQNVNEDLLTNQ